MILFGRLFAETMSYYLTQCLLVETGGVKGTGEKLRNTWKEVRNERHLGSARS